MNSTCLSCRRYNEVGHLRDEIERIEKALNARRTFEIIVVDDGSNDGSEHDLQTSMVSAISAHRQPWLRGGPPHLPWAAEAGRGVDRR